MNPAFADRHPMICGLLTSQRASFGLKGMQLVFVHTESLLQRLSIDWPPEHYLPRRHDRYYAAASGVCDCREHMCPQSQLLLRRWFTSWFVHHSFEHVTSNMALFLVVAYQIEEKYGTWRITLLYFMSALGGKPPRFLQHHLLPSYSQRIPSVPSGCLIFNC